eukprot:TRINITY_DN15775_c0_g1_i1.p1 TRINITY_DN15775_c0_g1~~TRINITY_DN15775_c0_g1_i1.p1  ORF type:complete len:53 (-),score=10.03 TRINITY_DN15775_c0_g1_i1:295-432(-)
MGGNIVLNVLVQRLRKLNPNVEIIIDCESITEKKMNFLTLLILFV